jgi:hypothetical protein
MSNKHINQLRKRVYLKLKNPPRRPSSSYFYISRHSPVNTAWWVAVGQLEQAGNNEPSEWK